MKGVGDPRSTIDKEIVAFDAEQETAFAESTIRELISSYSDNRDVRHVLVKVIAINALYHARVLDIDLQRLSIYIEAGTGPEEAWPRSASTSPICGHCQFLHNH